MFHKDKRMKLPLKTMYYLSFVFFIVIPILLVLIVVLIALNQQFKSQAIENIKRAQEAVIADFVSDEDIMSLRLSHMVYTNNNEILRYAAQTDTDDYSVRNDNEDRLSKVINLALEPEKDIIAVSFYMKDGKETYVLNEITRSQYEIKQTKWYRAALKSKNRVFVGCYDTKKTNDLYKGSKKDSLILVFALAPDVSTDRSQKIEMVLYYQSTKAAERIKNYNRDYLLGKNKLGITQITGDDKEVIFSTMKESNFSARKYTCIKSPIKFNNAVWYVESYIKTPELTSDYWNTVLWVLGAAIVVLLLAGYYSRYFLRSIVRPIEEISGGLRQVEEGNLEVHISSKGQSEIRNMIHQFNAMVRRLKALVDEYEAKIRSAEKTQEDYFAAVIKGEITPEELNKRSKEFFMEHYTVLGIHVENYNAKERAEDSALKLIKRFEGNPRFASRCTLYKESASFFLALYRVTEEDYSMKLLNMAEELQRIGNHEFGVRIYICIGQKKFGFGELSAQIKEIREKMCLRYLKGADSIIDLNQEGSKMDKILFLAKGYEKLAAALYTADEKNLNEEKDKMFQTFNNALLEEVKMQAFAVILALGNRFSKDYSNFTEIFGQEYNYIEKIERIEDVKSIKLWLTNYFAWIMDYTSSKLNIAKTDAILKAKRYISDHYEEADLSLTKVADYVGLNEKYFSNRFTKECGETFSSYLMELKIQKAKELLKTTNFKVYEIAEMVGYYNVEHFNRMFKKLNGISPARYRKDE